MYILSPDLDWVFNILPAPANQTETPNPQYMPHSHCFHAHSRSHSAAPVSRTPQPPPPSNHPTFSRSLFQNRTPPPLHTIYISPYCDRRRKSPHRTQPCLTDLRVGPRPVSVRVTVNIPYTFWHQITSHPPDTYRTVPYRAALPVAPEPTPPVPE